MSGQPPAAPARPSGELVFGFHPVRELLRREPERVRRLWIASGRGGQRLRELADLAARHGIATAELAERELDRLCAGVHNGFAAEVGAPAGQAGPAADPDLQVLVEDIQDPRNLGALLRVCEGAGVGRVMVRDRGSAPLSPAAVKASAGASDWLEVERVTNSATAIEEAKTAGFWVYGVAPGGDLAWDVELSGKVLLVFGGEEKGLRHLTRERCDRLVGLPMRGRVESLNLATAAAAVLYEAVRQRTKGKPR